MDALSELVHALTNEARHAVLHDLGNRTARPGQHRRATGHGLDHDQAERLGPIDGESECECVAEEFTFFSIRNFTDELDVLSVDVRLHFCIEVFLSSWPFDLGRNLQRHSTELRHADGFGRSFVASDSSQERQVLPRLTAKRKVCVVQAMVDGSHPRQVGHRLALSVANRNVAGFRPCSKSERGFHEAEFSVKRRDYGNVGQARQRQHPVVMVIVDQVELACLAGHSSQQRQVKCGRVLNAVFA